MGGKKKYIEMFGSFMKPFNYYAQPPWGGDKCVVFVRSTQQTGADMGKLQCN